MTNQKGLFVPWKHIKGLVDTACNGCANGRAGYMAACVSCLVMKYKQAIDAREGA